MKADISLATYTGHFNLLTTLYMAESGWSRLKGPESLSGKPIDSLTRFRAFPRML